MGSSTKDSIGSNTGYISVCSIVNSYIRIVGLRECSDLEIVPICPVCSHPNQIAVEIFINLLLGDRRAVEGSRFNVLPLRIATVASSILDGHEVLEVVGIISHVSNDIFSDLLVITLVTVDLIAESVE